MTVDHHWPDSDPGSMTTDDLVIHIRELAVVIPIDHNGAATALLCQYVTALDTRLRAGGRWPAAWAAATVAEPSPPPQRREINAWIEQRGARGADRPARRDR